MRSGSGRHRIFTIGHGNAPFSEIARLLLLHGVTMLVDVRSTPFSRYAPDFRKSELVGLAATVGLGYRWMGDRLGGRPTDSDQPESTDSDWAVIKASAGFRSAVSDVVALNRVGPVALLCAEREPQHCHRSRVLAPVLEELGVEVFHIRPDGSAQRHQPTLNV